MKIALLIILSYLIGSISPSYILGKIKGIDIRETGSKNAGATNTFLNVGKRYGVITAVFDIFKAFACYELAEYFFPETPLIAIICGFTCVMGHIFPFYLKFKGGKGFACLGGMILGFDVKVFLIMLLGAIIVLLIVDYIGVVTCVSAISFSIVYFVLTREPIGTALLVVMAVVIVFKHIGNFKRIKHGIEIRFSGLWNKEKEEKRVRENLEKLNRKDEK